MKNDMPKLSDQMPDRIMAQIPDDGKSVGLWHPTARGWSVEYVKADRVARLEAALRFYADPKRYQDVGEEGCNDIAGDRGEIARKALGEASER